MSEQKVSLQEADLKEIPTKELMQMLDDLIGEMGSDELALEELFGRYQMGLMIAKECELRLGTMETKLHVLHEQAGLE